MSAGEPSTRIVIEAGRTSAQYWRDLWRYRELLYFLAWRDIAVHYKQTVIGVAWALLRPLATVFVFVLVFGKLAGLASKGEHYALLVLAGMLPWQLYATALSQASGSLVGNANLVSKVYFPRLLLPMSAAAVSLVDFLITLAAAGVLMVWDGVVPTWRVLTLPLFVAMAIAAALGAGLWLSALSVRYRDFRHVTPFLIQFGLYLSPVPYSSTIVPEQYRLLYAINPMVGVIDGFRWSLLELGNVKPNDAAFDPMVLVQSGLVIGLALLSGVWYFRKTERTFADVI